jgi:predicted metal-dependent hydrolase
VSREVAEQRRRIDPTAVAWLGNRPIRNKWASCSSNGYRNFNAELLALDPAFWD